VDLPPLEHEPPRSRATHGRRHPAEVEAHDDPLRGQRFQVHTPGDLPHEKARVQLTPADLCTGPPLAPLSEALDKRPQLLTRRGEVVFAPTATRPGHAPHDAGVLELLETSGEERARHQGHTPMKVAEATAPAEQLAQDERGPSLGDDLGGLGDRAELTVPLHLGPRIVNGGGRRKSNFCTSICCALPPGRPEPSSGHQGGALWLLDQLSRLSVATPPLSTIRPSPTWRTTSVEGSSGPATRSTTPPARSGTVRSIVIPRSSRAAAGP